MIHNIIIRVVSGMALRAIWTTLKRHTNTTDVFFSGNTYKRSKVYYISRRNYILLSKIFFFFLLKI